MRSTIFYSWQSDLPSGVNRSFIESALQQAIQQINKGLNVEDSQRLPDVELDKDTKGVTGSPPIVETIFKKISNAVAVVADVSYVGRTDAHRPVPNPNVLIEYGWALSELSHGSIVAVMNTAFGEPSWESLPFNMRHLRWPLTYCLGASDSAEQKKTARDELAKALAAALRPIVERRLANQPSEGTAFADQTPATWSPSAFWGLNEPFARRTSAWGTANLNVHDGEHLYLRLIPSKPIGPLNPTDAVKILERTDLQPMSDQRSGRAVGRNRYGAYVAFEDKGELWMVTQLLKTGELWGIEALTIEKQIHMARSKVAFGYVPCSAFERVFVSSLTNYLTFAKDVLKLERPLKYLAGLTRVQTFKMAVPQDRFGALFFGDFLENNIEYSGIIDTYDATPIRTLRPFFDHVWRESGLERPDEDRVIE